LVNALGEFKARGVAFISYQENVDTTTPQGELVFGMMANLAQFESALIGERVKAGMARAKAQGKRTSRPPIPEATRRRIAELHARGMSIKRIAKELGIAYGSAWNYAKGASGGRD
jgi:DNA invertase Pin-like site-specific DNA recombinase